MTAPKATQRAGGPAIVGPDEIATIRIELVESEPLIWRQVDVPTSITLKALHDIVQAAMDWQDYHLWQFTIGERCYGPAQLYEDWDRPADAAKVRLRQVLAAGRTVIDYLYDFGDGWEHRLIVDDVRAGEPGVAYPRYVGGEHAAPPEDSGGIPGFYNKLEIAADPQHPDHDDIVGWLEGYDPRTFDDVPIKSALGRIAVRRSAAQARARKRSAS